MQGQASLFITGSVSASGHVDVAHFFDDSSTNRTFLTTLTC